jgi:hypothetical protein
VSGGFVDVRLLPGQVEQVTQDSELLDPVDVPVVHMFNGLSTRFVRWGSIRISDSPGEIIVVT